MRIEKEFLKEQETGEEDSWVHLTLLLFESLLFGVHIVPARQGHSMWLDPRLCVHFADKIWAINKKEMM